MADSRIQGFKDSRAAPLGVDPLIFKFGDEIGFVGANEHFRFLATTLHPENEVPESNTTCLVSSQN